MERDLFGEDRWAGLEAQADASAAAAMEEARRLLAGRQDDPWAGLPAALSSADLYQILRIGRSTLHDALRRGDIPLPTLRVGAQGRLLWARGTVQRWLDGPTPPVAVDGHLVLKLEEAAEHLRLGRSTCYDLIRAGRLRSFNIGRLLRLPASTVVTLRQAWED